MSLSAATIAGISIGAVVGLGIVILLLTFLCCWAGWCTDPAVFESSTAEQKGIPLHSRTPALTQEQLKVRDEMMARYQRRRARQERRQQRRDARAARRLLEGPPSCLATPGPTSGDERNAKTNPEESLEASITSLTTASTAATTIASSTAVYGHATYGCLGWSQEGSEDFALHSHRSAPTEAGERSEGHGSRSSSICNEREACGGLVPRRRRSSSSSTTGRGASNAIATVKSYFRQRQRQRLRRREENIQYQILDQWDLPSDLSSLSSSSSELSPSASSLDGATPHPPLNDAALGQSCVVPNMQASGLDGSALLAADEAGNRRATPPSHVSVLIGPQPSNRVSKQEDDQCGAVVEMAAANDSALPAASSGVGGAAAKAEASRGGADARPPSGPHAGPPAYQRRRQTWKDMEENAAMSGFFNRGLCAGPMNAATISTSTAAAEAAATFEHTRSPFSIQEPN